MYCTWCTYRSWTTVQEYGEYQQIALQEERKNTNRTISSGKMLKFGTNCDLSDKQKWVFLKIQHLMCTSMCLCVCLSASVSVSMSVCTLVLHVHVSPYQGYIQSLQCIEILDIQLVKGCYCTCNSGFCYYW